MLFKVYHMMKESYFIDTSTPTPTTSKYIEHAQLCLLAEKRICINASK